MTINLHKHTHTNTACFLGYLRAQPRCKRERVRDPPWRWQKTKEGQRCQQPNGVHRKEDTRGGVFWQQRGAELADLLLSLKTCRRRTYSTNVFCDRRHLISVVKMQLSTIHPNPGPRDKTEEGRRKRREGRYKKRAEKRARREVQVTSVNNFLSIITWNVQGMSISTANRRKLRAVAQYVNNNKFDVALLTEIRAKGNGCVWLGEEDKLTAVIHSEKAAILLRGRMLDQWCSEGQKVLYDKRTVSVKVEGKILTSTYMPVWHGNNSEELENEKEVLKKHAAWAKANEVLVIGGDYNAHIGGGEDRPGVCGRFGLRQSNHPGTELLEWLEENGLCYVNSFFNHKRRGTWYNQMLGRWYELDGFIMRNEDRHKYARKINTVGECTISDHKPKKLVLNLVNRRKSCQKKKPKIPRISWEKLRQENIAIEYRNKVSELWQEAEEEQIEAENKGCTIFDHITKIVTKAAETVCGTEERQLENPWMVGRDAEIQNMRSRITAAINRRNEKRTQQRENGNRDEDRRIEEELEAARNELRAARRALQRTTRTWEREYWETILEDCNDAANRNDAGVVYKNLRKLGKRGMKTAPTSTTLKKEDFKNHFQNVSKDRFENPPEEIENSVNQMRDISGTAEAREWGEALEQLPTGEEVYREMRKMNESAPGEDGVRLIYILQGGPVVLNQITRMIQFMFKNDADKWEDSLKTGLVIPLHKKGDRNIPHNFRGVCLLSMGSRILARILASRLRVWSEKLHLLDDDQAGFREKRSTADITQIFYRIQEDSKDMYKRAESAGITIPESSRPAARLLDLRKAYPRVSKPALWQILKKYGMGPTCLRAIQNLHETTTYKVKSREGCSKEWVPERGLREGCPSSPPLFNIFHQVVMRLATKARKRKAEELDKEVGIKMKWVPGSSFPAASRWEKKNSEAKRIRIERGLFADDTTIAGQKGELEDGVRETKEVMGKFEERNNDDKEEILEFGTEESNKIRMLGVWLGEEEDIKQRLKRAGAAWIKVKNQLKGSKLSKRMQAKIVESCVESTLLFDCSVRTWRVGEIAKLQRCMDKKYRSIWARRTGPPLIQMQQQHKNMFDVRRELGVKSVRYKVEKRVLERIGHVFRMEDDRTVKAAVLGWLEDLEPLPKLPGKKRKTLLYWKQILREAQIDSTNIAKLTEDRKEWKSMINSRMNHIAKWEERGGHGIAEERGERVSPVPQQQPTTFECEVEGCGKVCSSKGGLTLHRRKMHEISKEKVVFKCQGCGKVFKQNANLLNHLKSCNSTEAAADPTKTKCGNCRKDISKSNFSRHRRVCGGNNDQQVQEPAEYYVAATYMCPGCGTEQAKTNKARHRRVCGGSQ